MDDKAFVFGGFLFKMKYGNTLRVPDIGERFLNFTVVSSETVRVKRGKNYYRHIKCKCDCGIENLVKLGDLLKCKMKHCKCSAGNFKHGLRRTREYSIWCGMKDRCYNKNSEYYSDYGGRGISVCERWLYSCENFVKDMGKTPSPSHTLDRFPDVNGNYKKSNCRWATKKEQANNRRNTISYTIDGVTKTVIEWCEIYCISDILVRQRVRDYGWEVLAALTKQVRISKRVYKKTINK